MRPKSVPTDRLPPQSSIDARGRVQERFSEYFDFVRWPEKAERKVTRHELLAILDRRYKVERDMKWYRRLWRFLTAKHGSGPVVVADQPKGA